MNELLRDLKKLKAGKCLSIADTNKKWNLIAVLNSYNVAYEQNGSFVWLPVSVAGELVEK